MAEAEDRLLIHISTSGAAKAEVEIAGVNREVKAGEKAAARAHPQFTKLGGAFGGLKGAIGGTVGLIGAAGLAGGLGEAVKSAQALQEAQSTLGASVKSNTHAPVKQAVSNMSDFADSMATAGGFTPTASIQGMTQLVRVTGNVSKAEKDMTLSTNIARGAHVSLERATRSVMMAETGHATGLSRLGILLPKGATATQALAAMQDKYARSTTAYSKTSSGQMNNFRNAIEELGSKFGTLLLPIIGRVAGALSGFVNGMLHGKGVGGELVSTLKDVAHFAGDVWSWMKKNATILEILGGAIGGVIVAYKAWKIATAIMTGAQVLLDAALDANPIGIVILAIAALVGAFIVAYKKVTWFRDGVNAVVKGLVAAWNWFKNAVINVIDFVKKHWQLLLIAMGPLGWMILAAIKFWQKFGGTVISILGWIIDKIGWVAKRVPTVWASVKQAIIGPISDAVTWVIHRVGDIVTFVSGLPGKISHAATGIWDGLKSGLRDAINWIITQLNGLINDYNSIVGKIPLLGGSLKIGNIGLIAPGRTPTVNQGAGLPPILGAKAGGGSVGSSGRYLVGERGPEMVTLPRGAYVMPNDMLSALQSGKTGGSDRGDIHIYNVLDGKVLSKSVVRQGLLQQARM